MTAPPPDALLLISSTCPHCAAVAEAALRLLKEGLIGRLEVVSLDVHPRIGTERGVRSVPWLRLGPFELTGAQGYHELADWAEKAAAGDGWSDYALRRLEQQQLDGVVGDVRDSPQRLGALVRLLASDDLELGARIGISAVVEELAGSTALRALVPQLEQLTLDGRARIRADACHFLGLAGDPSVGPAIRRLLDDEDPEVREIAGETLALLDLAADGPETQETAR